MISLGFQQYRALESLFDEGSPVHIEPLQDYPGNIVDVKVTYFVNEARQATEILTAEGDFLPFD